MYSIALVSQDNQGRFLIILHISFCLKLLHLISPLSFSMTSVLVIVKQTSPRTFIQTLFYFYFLQNNCDGHM